MGWDSKWNLTCQKLWSILSSVNWQKTILITTVVHMFPHQPLHKFLFLQQQNIIWLADWMEVVKSQKFVENAFQNWEIISDESQRCRMSQVEFCIKVCLKVSSHWLPRRTLFSNSDSYLSNTVVWERRKSRNVILYGR